MGMLFDSFSTIRRVTHELVLAIVVLIIRKNTDQRYLIM